MRILYLKTGIISEQDVLETLLRMKFDVKEYNAPEERKKLSNEYAVRLFNEISEYNPDLVFCLRYFSTISVVCNTMGKKYVAWICKSYEPDIYSCTLLNECNHIFFADKSLADEFGRGDFKHIHFLPLGVNKERIKSVIEMSDDSFEYDSDLTMMQDIILRSDMDNNPISDDSPLSEATKGYLEGCLACQHQLSGLPSMSQKLTGYVWENLLFHFPPCISGDSIESQAHYYDYNFFNALITYSQRDIHFHHIASCIEFEKVNLYNGCNHFLSDVANVHEKADYLMQVPIIARKSKINLVITHRNWKSGIPQISWDIMAAGGFLINNFQMDFLEVFGDIRPVMYIDKTDLRLKGKEYLKKETERRRIASELSDEIMDKHIYEKRIKAILEKI